MTATTRARRLTALCLIGWILSCLVFVAFVTFSGAAVPADRGSHVEVSSIDLSIGTRESILSAQRMMPGDVRTTIVSVANPTDRSLVYSMSQSSISRGGAALAAALTLTVRSVGSACGAMDGALLYDGPLDKVSFDQSAGGRSLDPASAEILCFRVVLPVSADDSLQGLAGNVVLSFVGTAQASRDR